MSRKPVQALVSLFGLPHEHSQVVTSRDQNLARAVSCFVVPFKGVGLHRLHVSIELFSVLIVTAGTQHVVCAQRQTVDPMSMALQLTLQYALVGLPAADYSVLAGGVKDVFAAPKNLRHRGSMTPEHSQTAVVARGPDSDRHVF